MGNAVSGLCLEGPQQRSRRHQCPQRRVPALAPLAGRREPLSRAVHEFFRERVAARWLTSTDLVRHRVAGPGHETTFSQLVGEWLGVPYDCIRLVTGDTARVSVGGGAHSGRALRLGSIVMLNASNEIIDKGKNIAAHLFEADAADIEFAGGEFAVTGTDRRIRIFEVAREALQRNDLADDLRGALQGIGDETVTLAAFPYGCHVCEVEVDPETGIVDIVRYSAVDDVGRAVNPMIVHGRVHGGIVQGIGQALMEDACYDRDTAQPIAGSFMDYAMPRADRVPHFDCDLSEVPSLTHPLGIRPTGEGGSTPALAVVINAVVDALAEFGVRHVEMPAGLAGDSRGATKQELALADRGPSQADCQMRLAHARRTRGILPNITTPMGGSFIGITLATVRAWRS
jgi:CO/xanthine dehydrogenase Mo-binding subunit